jgi:hypothetical protein
VRGHERASCVASVRGERGTTPLNAGRGTADVVSVLRILVVALFGLFCVSFLGLAALYLVVLKREGAAWSYRTRLWVRLKAVEYVLIVLLVVVAAADAGPSWTLLVVAIPLPVLWVARSRIRRRAERSPGWIDDDA